MLLYHLIGLALVVATAASDGSLCSSSMADRNIILLNIAETFPINTPLARLNVTGTDTEISLEISRSDYIDFKASTRELISRRSFNVSGDATMRIFVNLTCNIRSSSLPPATLQIIVQVTDMNNNPPYFVNLPYAVNISERTAIDTTVFQGVEASDADPCDRGYLSYSVLHDANPFSSYFSFPVWSVGKLVLMKRLDYEKVQKISLRIVVMDNGNNITIMGQLQPQHTATTTMMIHIIPGDDYNPKFDQLTYTGVVMDTAPQSRSVSIFPPIGASIKYATATEEIVYSILQDPNNADGSYFVINNRTGVIMTSASSNFGANQLAFQVQATKVNETHRSGSALVRLNVIRSSQPLAFTQRIYSAAVDDSTPIATLVATVAVIDGGLWPNYSFNGEVTDFIIDSGTGEIRTANKLNYKTTPLYNLSVLARDSNYTNDCLVIITIMKLNKYNPRFAQRIYKFNVSADSNSVGRVQAVDEDMETVLIYHLFDSSGFGFAVDGAGHLTYSSSTLLSNSSVSQSLLVVVEDDGTPPRQDSCLVVVSWIASWVPEVPQPIPLCASAGQSWAYYIVVIVLAIVAGLLLLLVILLAICLYRKGRSKATPPPRVTIEVDRTPQKVQHTSSQGSSRSAVGGFEVTKEYGPYLPYVPGESTDDLVVVPSSSVLNSTDKLQKLRIYHSVPTDRSESAYRNAGTTADPRSGSQQSKKPPSYPPYSSTSISTTSSPPSSRVERYNFEEDSGSAHPSGSIRPPRSVSPMRRASQTPAPMGPHNSVPGPRRTGGRLQATVAALRDSNSGDTSSTETLVTPVHAKVKPSTVSFVDNPGGYLSSQEGVDVSMSALTRPDGESGIIVYY